MVFSSLFFTFFFLPIVIVLYYLAKEKYRNYILLVASLYFYSYGEPTFVFVMIVSIIANYLLALGISKLQSEENKYVAVVLIVDVIINVGILFIFKYLDFAIGILNKLFNTNFHIVGIALPIGISFFTFQAMSYVIDVYRRNVDVQKNPLYLALYISFFPQLIAGPIVRYSTIAGQITNRICSTDKFAEGIRRFFGGFGKKVIIANNLSVVAGEAFGMDFMQANPILLWIGSICYSLQIYYDFSGYSDMAIGLGKIFGFDFDENFNYPYISKSITEFWRRWHISLGQWFRDYVYIPLGGSRVSAHKHIFNMLVVWLLTGIWHGANYTFIVWGLEYFILIVIEKYIVKLERRQNVIIRILWQIFTLFCVNFGWVIFNASGIHEGINYCLAMLCRYQNQISIDAQVIRCLREYGIFIILGIVFSTPLMKRVKEKINETKLLKCADIVIPIGYGVVFLWSVSYIILGAHNPFIYFNF